MNNEQTSNNQQNKQLNIGGVSGSICPKCGYDGYEEYEELEYENGGDDPMYGGALILVKITYCGNCG
jgi:hypothetical protein